MDSKRNDTPISERFSISTVYFFSKLCKTMDFWLDWLYTHMNDGHAQLLFTLRIADSAFNERPTEPNRTTNVCL